MLKYAILGFLNYRSMFGYELKQSMDGSIQHFWHSKLSQIYMTLKSLESDKLLVSEIENQDDKPDRKRYTITELGKQDLREWLNKPLLTINPHKDELLLKLFFSASVDKSDLIQELSLLKKLHLQKLKTYQTSTKEIISKSTKYEPKIKEDAILWEATRRMGEMYESMYIQWIDETLIILKNKFKGRKS